MFAIDHLLSFDSIDQGFARVTSSVEWTELQKSFAHSSLILLIGNGGNLAVADHAAIDISRLTDKLAAAPGSGILASSIINDKTHDDWLYYWVSLYLRRIKIVPESVCVIGFSSSGRSANVLKALQFATEQGCHTGLISAVPLQHKANIQNTVVLDVNQYHTSEVMFLLLTYALIEESGYACPDIKKGRDMSSYDYSR